MVARSVSLHAMMRSLKGFQDKIVLVASAGLEAIGLSFCDHREMQKTTVAVRHENS